MHKPKPQWRTFLGTLALGLMILVAVYLCPLESRSAVASTAIPALSSLGLWLAGKSAAEHATAKPPPPVAA